MPAAHIPAEAITGLVLAGGAGRRMGGRDKGLLPYHGRPLVQHAIERLAPQVGTLALSANRHLREYACFGHPVWPDACEGFAGPLAGWAAALAHCATPYLASVPCDAPHFPLDLVERLAAALAEADAEIATAAITDVDGSTRMQPVFSLLARELAQPLRDALAAGEHRVGAWAARQRQVIVIFDDPGAFANLNTPADLA
jgi:molybdopterin-guanine dinucleotide biosynthesis protein A